MIAEGAPRPIAALEQRRPGPAGEGPREERRRPAGKVLESKTEAAYYWAERRLLRGKLGWPADLRTLPSNM